MGLMKKNHWYTRLKSLIEYSLRNLYERDQTVRLSLLGALAGESVFLLGPPGVGKSLIARRLKYCIRDGRAFEYLMGRFSTPDELFGPVSIQRLTNQDRYERLVSGYLPDADIVFLDEVWNASPPIQNALLTAMNEKRYRNGTEELTIPMKLLMGASNSLHPGEETAAFWDRFLIRLQVHPITEQQSFLDFLQDQEDPYADPVPPEVKITREEWETFQAQSTEVTLPPVITNLLYQVRSALAADHPSSDRRWKKILRLLKASALANGRDSIGLSDCFLLEHCLWETPDQAETMGELINQAVSRSLQELQRPLMRELEGCRGALQEIEQTLADQGTYQVHEPLIIDGEYYRFLPDSEDSAESAETTTDREFRIWRPDAEPILEESPREQHAEIFVHHQGRLQSTLRGRLCPRGSTGNSPGLVIRFDDAREIRGTIEVQPRMFRPETPEQFATILGSMNGTPQLESWKETLKENRSKVLQALATIDSMGRDLSQEISEHLFTPREELQTLDAPLVDLARDFSILGETLDLYLNSRTAWRD